MTQKTIKLWLFSFIIATIFILILSPETSFLYSYKMPMVDPIVFYNIGKYWFKDGSLPYVDLWELKGPIILFINGIGYWFTHSLHGIALIQIPCFAVAIYYSFKLFSKKYSSVVSLVLSTAACFCVALTYEGGDNCEEFLFPFLIASYYGFYKWADGYSKKHLEHNWKYAIIYGAVLGISLFVRLTNALGVMGGVAFIFFVLLFNKKWNNIYRNAIAFILGFAIPTVPFVVYFWSKGALYEMWYGTFLYNLEYTKDSAMTFSLVRSCTVYIFGTMLLCLGIIQLLFKKEYIKGGLWISSSLLLILWLANSNGFAHYGNLCYPCLCIVLVELQEYINSKKKEFCFVISVLIVSLSLFFMRWHLSWIYTHQYDNTDAEILLSHVPSQEYNSLALYNCNYELYYYYDIKPVVKYFGLQDFVGYKSPVMQKRIFDEFENVSPKWILIKSWVKEPIIQNILKRNYREYKRSGKYTLFKIDQSEVVNMAESRFYSIRKHTYISNS